MLFVLTVTSFEKKIICLIRYSSVNTDVLKFRSGHFSTQIIDETLVRRDQWYPNCSFLTHNWGKKHRPEGLVTKMHVWCGKIISVLLTLLMRVGIFKYMFHPNPSNYLAP